MAFELAHAGLEFEGRWYYSKYQRSSIYEPHTAVTTLIQGIYEKFPAQARAMLRSRIYATEIVPHLDTEMVKVSAKRISLTDKTDWSGTEVTFDGVIESGRDDGPLHARNRMITAEIRDRDGVVIAQAKNENGVNRTLHAEVLCIQKYWSEYKRPIPSGATIHTSLSPCRQCTAMIHVAFADGEFAKVIYQEKDPGRLAISVVNTSSASRDRRWTLSNTTTASTPSR